MAPPMTATVVTASEPTVPRIPITPPKAIDRMIRMVADVFAFMPGASLGERASASTD